MASANGVAEDDVATAERAALASRDDCARAISAANGEAVTEEAASALPPLLLVEEETGISTARRRGGREAFTFVLVVCFDCVAVALMADDGCSLVFLSGCVG